MSKKINNYNHYIITPFNLLLKWNGKAKKIEDEQLEKRFKIFEEYTIPSVVNQSDKNFTWLVLFSTSTSETFKNKIKKYQTLIENFVPIYIDDANAKNFKEMMVDYIKKDNSQIIITTRLDNDDSINKDFIKNIHNNIENTDKDYIITFPLGYQFDIKTNMIRKYYFPNNHFTSHVTSIKEKTIHSFTHMDIFENCAVKIINKDDIMWIENIHDDNVFNCMGSISIKDYVRNVDLKKLFNIDIRVSHKKSYILKMYFIFLIKKLFIKRKRIMNYIKNKIKLKKIG